MRITFLETTTALGGAQRATLDLAAGLRARKHQVRMALPGSGPLSDACVCLDLPVTFIRLPSWMPAGCTPHWHRPGWWAITRLARALRQDGTDWVRTEGLGAAWIGGVAARLAGARLIWHISDMQPLAPSHFLVHLCHWMATHVTTAPAGLFDLLPRVLGTTARLRRYPPGVDLLRFPARDAPPPRGEGLPVVGMLGAWEHREGQEVLLKAFRLLHDGWRRAHLRLIGPAETPDAQRHRAMIVGAVKAAGLSRYVSVEEHVPDLAAFWAACDLVVAPSLHTSSGRSAMEAAATGRPVVASRVDGLSEVVEDGHTGLLIPPQQPRALADALALLLASRPLRVEMGRLARIRAEEQFTLEHTLDAFEALVRSTCPRPHPARESTLPDTCG